MSDKKQKILRYTAEQVDASVDLARNLHDRVRALEKDGVPSYTTGDARPTIVVGKSCPLNPMPFFWYFSTNGFHFRLNYIDEPNFNCYISINGSDMQRMSWKRSALRQHGRFFPVYGEDSIVMYRLDKFAKDQATGYYYFYVTTKKVTSDSLPTTSPDVFIQNYVFHYHDSSKPQEIHRHTNIVCKRVISPNMASWSHLRWGDWYKHMGGLSVYSLRPHINKYSGKRVYKFRKNGGCNNRIMNTIYVRRVAKRRWKSVHGIVVSKCIRYNY